MDALRGPNGKLKEGTSYAAVARAMPFEISRQNVGRVWNRGGLSGKRNRGRPKSLEKTQGAPPSKQQKKVNEPPDDESSDDEHVDDETADEIAVAAAEDDATSDKEDATLDSTSGKNHYTFYYDDGVDEDDEDGFDSDGTSKGYAPENDSVGTSSVSPANHVTSKHFQGDPNQEAAWPSQFSQLSGGARLRAVQNRQYDLQAKIANADAAKEDREELCSRLLQEAHELADAGDLF